MPKLSSKQDEATRAIIEHEQGIIKAATGFGKTVVVLKSIALARQKALVVVDKKHIAEQWRIRAREWLGIESGIIGDSAWEERGLTIALQQTLWSRKEELDRRNWWARFGFVCLDEQHHIPSRTYLEIIQSFPAKYRIGVSATKGKSPSKERISELVFGPVIFEHSELAIKPQVKVIDTNFKFNYHPTHKYRGKIKRNNYQAMIEALISDQYRNALIIKMIDWKGTNLVVSRRILHLQELEHMLRNKGYKDTFLMTGKESTARRQHIIDRADEGEVTIFSTVADEALDIPRLDRLYSVFPVRNPENIKQLVGRICRHHKAKLNPVCYDFVDKRVGVLMSQYKTRLYKYYKPHQLEVCRTGI